MKVLGIKWKPTSDTLKVSVDFNHNKKRKGLRPEAVELEDIPFTRRVCLRLVNGIFDPLGIFTPITVRLKILMKEQFVTNSAIVTNTRSGILCWSKRIDLNG